MSSRRALSRRLAGSILALATLVGSTVAAPLGAPAVAAPTYGVDERAQAIASPSLAFLEVTYTGIVRDKKSGKPLQREPMVIPRRCTGFVINPDGHVLTTGLCVQPSHDIVRRMTFHKIGSTRVEQGKLAANQLDGYVDGLMRTADFTGERPGTKPSKALFAQLNVATAGTTGKPAIRASVVAAQAEDDGNVAVVKLEQGNLPAVEIDTAGRLAHGSSVIILGFDTKDANGDIGTYSVQAKTVDVVATQQADRLRVTEDVGPYSHGGIAVDTSGRVVAMLDADLSARERPNRALIGAAPLTAVQSDNGVKNQLSDVDRAYRKGLDAYFGGRYSTAIREFDTVLAQTPGNLLANIYRKNASDRYAIEGDAVENSADWLLYVLSAAGGALIILLITLAWRFVAWRRRSANPDLLAPVSTTPYAPVSGAGMYPVSGPPGRDPWSSPGQPTAAQPMPAPPGVPVPSPPLQMPGPQPVPPLGAGADRAPTQLPGAAGPAHPGYDQQPPP